MTPPDLRTAVVTGATGTVGRALVQALKAAGTAVHAWDRARLPVTDDAAARAFLDRVRPDALFHLAIPSEPTGAPDEFWEGHVRWTDRLARHAERIGAAFVFTSTVMVWAEGTPGPLTPATPPDAPEGYGFEKRTAEARVLATDTGRVVRIGWQMALEPEGNTMTAQLAARARGGEAIGASTAWQPACSFLPDTAAALVRASEAPPGLYLADSNTGHSFYAIATALRDRLTADWAVVPEDEPVWDQRMRDDRLGLPPLVRSLPALRP